MSGRASREAAWAWERATRTAPLPRVAPGFHSIYLIALIFAALYALTENWRKLMVL
jgi:hypothetical protein